MSSPITFGGFNNIDFGVVLNAIMQQERAPLSAIETQRTALQAQNTAFATFATRLGALESAVAALADSNALSKVAATSSDDKAVGISAGAASVTGRYEIAVSTLARAQVTASNTTYGGLDTVVATSGVVSLAQFSQPPIDIPITGATTLEDLADAINQHPDSPVSASIVQVTPGQYRLVLTGRATGSDHGFTVGFSTPLAGGVGMAFTDTDNDGLSGNSLADNAQSATDATLTVNNVPVTSSSNTLQDVIPGVTLNLKKADSTATIDVAQDQADTLAKVEAFATAYNNVITFINDQKGSNGAPGISRDALVRGLRDTLRSTILGAEEDGVLERLPQIGIGFDSTGKIKIDKTLLTSALETTPLDVQRLFGGEDGTGGRFGALEKLIAGYTESGGLVANVRERIDSQVSRLGARLVTLESQLALRRAALQQEFIAADRAMSQLNSQGNSLGQLGGQYRLF